MYHILDTGDLSLHRCHVDQIGFEDPGQSIPNWSVSSATNDVSLDIENGKGNSNEILKFNRLQQKNEEKLHKSRLLFNVWQVSWL